MKIEEISSLTEMGQAFPGVFSHIPPFAEALMRADAPISRADRELLAAFVSALNECEFCHGAHKHVALAYGVDEGKLTALVQGEVAAEVEPKLVPVLEFARALTKAPARMTDAHYDAMRAVGWDDDAIGYVVGITAFFNMMNRLVEGFGIELPEDGGAVAGQRLATDGYDRS